MYVNRNNLAERFYDLSPYIDHEAGIQYPGNWDKSTISSLMLVTEATAPEHATITGREIVIKDGVATEVLTYTVATADEIEAIEKRNRNSERYHRMATLERGQTLRMMGDALLGSEEDKVRLIALRGEVSAIRATIE